MKPVYYLEDADSEILVSPISAAEIACAVSRGRISINEHWKKWFRKYITMNHWKIVHIDLEIVEEAYSLPEEFHADPVDRILTATARLRRCVLLTADKKILDYPHVKGLW